MIDRTLDTSESARLPVPAGLGRGLVLGSVFVCAACGLVYELELVALASYLAGDTVTQASVVLSVMVFAMGVGSLLAKRLRCRAATGFGTVEVLLALVGGGSAIALYASFAWLDAARGALVVFSLAIGVLTGAEMPLLMTLIQRVRKQDPSGAVADLFAADYVGALVGGLTFPFLLLPFFGQLTGALLTGVVNAAAGGVVVLWLFRRDVTSRVRWGLCAANAGVLLLLIAGTAFVGPFEEAARQAVYGAGVRVAVRSDGQEIVLTGSAPPGSGARALRLYLDGRLRASSTDESRYHRELVDPAMDSGPHGRVLILGGGDGLALREVLRYPGVREVTVLEPDAALARLARSDPGLRRLNRGAFGDPRVRLRTGDVFRRLRARVSAYGQRAVRGRWFAAQGASGAQGAQRIPGRSFPYDVIVSDLPGPAVSVSAKLYTQEFYGLAARSLSPGGRLVVHAGALTGQPRQFWTVDSTVRAAGLRTLPYAVPAGGAKESGPRAKRRPGTGAPPDWGFVLASRETVRVRGERSPRPAEPFDRADPSVPGAGTGYGSAGGPADGSAAGPGEGGAARVSRTGGAAGRAGGRGGGGPRGVGAPGPEESASPRGKPAASSASSASFPPAAFSPHELRAARQLAERHRIRGLPPATLMHPRY